MIYLNVSDKISFFFSNFQNVKHDFFSKNENKIINKGHFNSRLLSSV
jgi:hypothetical protein